VTTVENLVSENGKIMLVLGHGVRVEVLTAVLMKMQVLWDMTLVSPAFLFRVYHGRFEVPCHFHLQGKRLVKML
jgi:hypothetical protein